jgi:hypothetical protein
VDDLSIVAAIAWLAGYAFAKLCAWAKALEPAPAKPSPWEEL